MQEPGQTLSNLNMYYLSGEPNLTGQDLEDTYVELVSEVNSTINIPLAVKIESIHHLPAQFCKTCAGRGRWPGAIQSFLPAGF